MKTKRITILRDTACEGLDGRCRDVVKGATIEVPAHAADILIGSKTAKIAEEAKPAPAAISPEPPAKPNEIKGSGDSQKITQAKK